MSESTDIHEAYCHYYRCKRPLIPNHFYCEWHFTLETLVKHKLIYPLAGMKSAMWVSRQLHLRDYYMGFFIQRIRRLLAREIDPVDSGWRLLEVAMSALPGNPSTVCGIKVSTEHMVRLIASVKEIDHKVSCLLLKKKQRARRPNGAVARDKALQTRGVRLSG